MPQQISGFKRIAERNFKYPLGSTRSSMQRNTGRMREAAAKRPYRTVDSSDLPDLAFKYNTHVYNPGRALIRESIRIRQRFHGYYNRREAYLSRKKAGRHKIVMRTY